jgi:hypothetical protein
MLKKIVTFITYYNIDLQLLNYEIPSQLNYNSIEQAIVYVEKNNDNYNYNLKIPKSFYSLDSSYKYEIMYFNITNSNLNKNSKGSATDDSFYIYKTGPGCYENRIPLCI